MWVFCSAGWGNQHTHPVSVVWFWTSYCRHHCLPESVLTHNNGALKQVRFKVSFFIKHPVLRLLNRKAAALFLFFSLFFFSEADSSIDNTLVSVCEFHNASKEKSMKMTRFTHHAIGQLTSACNALSLKKVLAVVLWDCYNSSFIIHSMKSPSLFVWTHPSSQERFLERMWWSHKMFVLWCVVLFFHPIKKTTLKAAGHSGEMCVRCLPNPLKNKKQSLSTQAGLCVL